jgi:tRNA1Val (adenine37-N6)-methyltransferase
VSESASPTRDSLLAGALTLWQPARGHGYRFDLDPVLLAGFAPPAGHILDLGAGCGVIGLLLLALGKSEQVTAVEIQPELAALAGRNARENLADSRMRVLCGDLRRLDLPRVDAVVFNPPYFRTGEGRVPPDQGRAAGRYESAGTLADFMAAAARALENGGRVSGIVPARRACEVESGLIAHGLFLQRRRDVCARAGQSFRALLWQAVKAPGARAEPPVVEPPLVVHATSGREFSPEVRALLRE